MTARRSSSWTRPSAAILTKLREQLDKTLRDGADALNSDGGESLGDRLGGWTSVLEDVVGRALGPEWAQKIDEATAGMAIADTSHLKPQYAAERRAEERHDALIRYLDVGAAALTVIDHELERQEAVPAPVAEATLPLRDFSFVASKDLRAIASRDYDELRALPKRAMKSRVLLAGAVAEALLMDALERKGRTRDQILELSFYGLIGDAEGQAVISARTAKVAHSLRDFRNLVHPAVELRDGLLKEGEADASISLLQLVIEDLRK